MKTVVPLSCLLLVAAVAAQTGRSQSTGTVELKTVKYAGLVDAVKGHKGKVIVIDFWADY